MALGFCQEPSARFHTYQMIMRHTLNEMDFERKVQFLSVVSETVLQRKIWKEYYH